MITTVTLNPSIDREYFIDELKVTKNQFIYNNNDLRVFPGGKGLLTAINLKNLGYHDVQNIGFIGGKQGLFFEKMVQEYKITTNYIYTENEMRNNIKLITKNPPRSTQLNDYTYKVNNKDVEELLKRFKRGIVNSDLIMICGSIPEGVNFDIYKKMIAICNKLDKDVYLEASGEVLNRALKEEPKLVIPYFKHTNKILDEEIKSFDDYIKAGKKLIAKGAQYVMLPYHCNRLLFSGERVFCLSPEEFCIRNIVGAGDAYNAGFYDYIFVNGFDFLEANRYAGAASLIIAEENKIFINSRDEIDRNLDRLIIEELEV